MIISVVNITNGRISDEAALRAIRAVNRQIEDDFAPYWGFGAQLRLEGRVAGQPKKATLPELRGDAVLYLWDRIDEAGADGYHAANYRGIAFGVVNVKLSQMLNEEWTVTFSHEALELLADPQVNLLAQGPHPDERGRKAPRLVYHWFEMCDAVQDESYAIDGVKVSNFVLPLYFTIGEQLGGRNDFLARVKGGKTLASFGINPGGYVGFFDPQLGEDDTRSRDSRGAARLALKAKFGTGRGAMRRERRKAPLSRRKAPAQRRRGQREG